MELRPAYKQTDVGRVPEDWLVAPLETFTSFISYGFTNPMPTSASGVYMVTARDINNGQILFDSARFTTEEAYRTRLTEKSRPRINDLLLTKDGTLGRLALVDDRKICINQSVALIRPNSTIVPGFLKMLLEAPAYQKRMLEDAGGSTIKHIYITIVNLMPVAVPPTKEEQHSVVLALGDVDELIGTLDKLIAKKRDLKQAALQQLLTGTKRLQGFNDDWAVKTLGELFQFSGGYSASRDQLSDEGHCYLHYGDIHGASKTFVDTLTDYQDIPKLNISLRRVSPNSLLEDGDVVFVDASEDDEGTSKHVVVKNKDNIPFISGLHTIVAKSRTDELSHEYRRYCFQTAAIRQQFLFYAVGTKVSGISKTNIAKLKMPVPSVPEQTAIADVLMDMDAELAALEQRRDKTHDLKQGMMQDLLTGKTRLV
jgi:type I restriction enzyme, S subunit